MRTRSPGLQALFSSCALKFTAFVTMRPYFGSATRRSTRTTTVFCILFETTTPMRLLRFPRSGCGFCSMAFIPLGLRGLRLELALDREAARDVALRLLEVGGRVEDPGVVLRLQLEQLALQVRDAR